MISLFLHGGGYLLGDFNGRKSFIRLISSLFFLLCIGYSGIECHLSDVFNMSVLHVPCKIETQTDAFKRVGVRV
jgi:hypothetical protein